MDYLLKEEEGRREVKNKGRKGARRQENGGERNFSMDSFGNQGLALILD